MIESDRKPTGLTFAIDRWLIADPKPAIRSILVPGDSKLEPIAKYRNVASVWTPGRAVAKLEVKGDTRRYSCTGFLIADDEVLTNEHCIPLSIPLRTPGACEDAIDILFEYDTDDATPRRFRCDQVLAKSAGLDYAVLRVAGTPGHDLGVLRLERTRSPAGGEDGDPLFVIQHAGGGAKTVAKQRCRADRVGVPGVETGGTDQDFDHICDTLGGSSGSPVLDRSGRVIGLHHFGFSDDAAVRRNQAVLMARVVASFPADVVSTLAP